MKILAFAATSSSKSINKLLVSHAANLVPNANVNIIDLNDYEMPIYSQDKEEALGIPEHAQRFFNHIKDADAVIVSFAEHNGSYTAAYKNVFDWASRIDMKVFQDKPVIYLATSPGPGGAASVLSAATNSAPYFGADVKASLSIPSFFDNFDMEANVISNDEIANNLKDAIRLIS